MDSITVITMTRKRPDLLKRAISSVRSQDYLGEITHLIIVDDCIQTAQALTKIESASHRKLISHFASRAPGEIPDSARLDLLRTRLSGLRNQAIQMADSRWIAFLDDDNVYEANHLSSLIACAYQNKYSAVHSYRKIYQADGSPYLEHRFPWVRDPEEGKRVYELCCARGVWIRDSNILQDRADPKGHPDPIRMIDTSVWLLERSLLLQYPIPQQFTQEDLVHNTGDDDKLLELLIEREVPIGTTGLPTLRYYLGGYSNASPLNVL